MCDTFSSHSDKARHLRQVLIVILEKLEDLQAVTNCDIDTASFEASVH
jgi:hypothetical protein